MQDGTALLGGHSWGGVVITKAGNHPKVQGLVYIAAAAAMRASPSVGRGRIYPVAAGAPEIRAIPAPFRQGQEFSPIFPATTRVPVEDYASRDSTTARWCDCRGSPTEGAT
jgi:pimeloyl-ACP methyl ester carboxylesterase